jgi:hypothetical protein
MASKGEAPASLWGPESGQELRTAAAFEKSDQRPDCASTQTEVAEAESSDGKEAPRSGATAPAGKEADAYADVTRRFGADLRVIAAGTDSSGSSSVAGEPENHVWERGGRPSGTTPPGEPFAAVTLAQRAVRADARGVGGRTAADFPKEREMRPLRGRERPARKRPGNMGAARAHSRLTRRPHGDRAARAALEPPGDEALALPTYHRHGRRGAMRAFRCISLDEFCGHRVVTLCVWLQINSGEIRPGSQGIALRVELLLELDTALASTAGEADCRMPR